MHADTIKDHIKEELLKEMYRSVEKMNQSIVDGDDQGATEEQMVQIMLRSAFENVDNPPS